MTQNPRPHRRVVWGLHVRANGPSHDACATAGASRSATFTGPTVPRLRSYVSCLSAFLLLACAPSEQPAMVGTLERHRIEIRAEFSEPITAIAVTEGQVIPAGTILVQQHAGRAQASLQQALARVARSEALLAELERGPRQEQIDRARANLAASRSALGNAGLVLQRTEDLRRQGLTSISAQDEAQSNWERRQAEVDGNVASLEELLAGTTMEEIEQARAAHDEASAALQHARIDLERLTLSTPSLARVDDILYQLGELPAAGAVVVVLLAEGAPWARLYVPEPLRARIRPDSRFKVRVDGDDRVFAGVLRRISLDAAFTPYFALTEHDRSRLSYIAEVAIPAATEIASGQPLQAWLEDGE